MGQILAESVSLDGDALVLVFVLLALAAMAVLAFAIGGYWMGRRAARSPEALSLDKVTFGAFCLLDLLVFLEAFNSRQVGQWALYVGWIPALHALGYLRGRRERVL